VHELDLTGDRSAVRAAAVAAAMEVLLARLG
jgi:nicotinamide-nucleotide amidase